jgi:peptidyl-prolyl cis-trans isomerase D
MLDQIRGGQRWLTGFFIIALGGVFVFFLVPGMGQQTGPSGGALVEVGEYRFNLNQFEIEREDLASRYQEALGDQFDATALEEALNEGAARSLVERAILAQEASKLGLVVSKAEVERTVLDSPSFRGADGRFDRDEYKGFVEWRYGSERNFVVDQRIRMLARKMALLVEENSRVSEAEARNALLRRLEEIQIAFVVLGKGRAVGAVEIPEEQLGEFLATREEEARSLYDERSAVYDVPERVRARHILLQLPSDAAEAEAAEVEARARGLLARLEAGEDFAEIAQEFSDDPGSKANGGDLGFFGRGQMVKPFEDVAFGLEPGVVSDPVRSDFGIHIIRVEEHTQASQTAFEAVRAELARELLVQERQLDADRELARKLADAVRGGQSLEDAARAEELTLERSGWLRRRPDGFVPSLGAAQDLLFTAFAMEPGQSSDQIFEVEGKLALVQLLDRQLPEDVDIEQGIEAMREEIRNQKRGVLAQSWIDARRKELAAAGQLAVDWRRDR